jgi:hypothetical protein
MKPRCCESFATACALPATSNGGDDRRVSRRVVRTKQSPFEVELFGVTDDAHDRERFGRRRRVRLFNRMVSVPTPEDVLVNKLRWWKLARRNKDFDDARNVLAVQRETLDWPYIEQWCLQLDLRAELDSLKRRASR